MTPLHMVGDFIRSLLLQVPLSVVQAIFVAIPILLIVWVLRMPNENTTPPDSKGGWGDNLKVGACIALVLQVLIYSFFALPG